MPTSPNLLSGLGATLSISATAGGSAVSGGGSVTGLVSISGPSMEMGTVPTTNLGSTAQSFRYTLLDPGTLNFSIQYDPANAQHVFLKTLMAVPHMANVTVTETDPVNGGTFSFSCACVLTGFEMGEASIDDIVVADCTLKLSGPFS